MPLTPFPGTLGPKRAAHLLRRATFGPSKDDIDTYAGKTAAAAVSDLFSATLPTPEAPIDPKTGTEWAVSGTTDANSGEGELQDFFKGWFMAQMMSSGVDPGISLQYSAREKIVFFIHTVLTAITTKIDSSRALYFQNQLFRMFALDKEDAGELQLNFKELTKKVSVDNAMLRLLDGNLNVNGSPNENYARELLELYTIGRGLEGHVPETTEPGDYFVYREADVQAAARVLSGWDFDDTFENIDPDTLLPRGKVKGSPENAASHDNTPKTFSDRFDGTVIQRPTGVDFPGTNPTEATAIDEISQLIDMIYTKRETALNICRRIYRHFVYHNITEDIDTNIISPLADTFVANGFKLQPVLEELFTSEHFYDATSGTVNDDNFGAIIRSPLDLMIGTFRLFGNVLPDYKTQPEELYAITGPMLSRLSLMGMNFYEPYDVAGYDAYHQFPIFHRAWISTNYLTRRYEFVRLLLEHKDDPTEPKIDAYNFVYNKIQFARAADAKLLIQDLAKYFLPMHENLTFDPDADESAGSELTAERIEYFLTAFLKSPQIDVDPEATWTDRWLHPENYQEPEVVIGQLRSLFNAMLQSPEYQLY